jgi:hypothetical protein
VKKPSIVNAGIDLPLPPREPLERRVADMKANGIRGFIPLVQAMAAAHGDEAYEIAQRVFAALGYEVSLERLKDPNEKGVSSYPWR